MSQQSGRGGMGMHKHGVSGRVPKNKSVAMARSREVNRELAERAARKRAHRPEMVGHVADLFISWVRRIRFQVPKMLPEVSGHGLFDGRLL